MLHHKAPHRNWMPNLKHLDLYKDKQIPVPNNLFDDFATRSKALQEQGINIDGDLYLDYDLKVPAKNKSENLPDETYFFTKEWQGDYGRMTEKQQAIWDAAYKDENETFRKANLKGEKCVQWKYQRYLKDYLRCIASVDENVGRVMDYLKKNNLEENTIVVYTSDQGFFLGEHGLFDKRFMYEESFKMPLIMRYPKEINSASNNTEIVQNLDFASTFLDYAGVPIPEDMQGVSMRRILNGESVDWRDAAYFHFYEYPAVGMVKRHYGIRSKRYKLIHYYYDIDEWELFDLQKDPNEMKNVFSDPGCQAVRKEMEKKLQQVREFYQDTDEKQFLPKPRIQVKHLAIGADVSFKQPYAKKYDGGSPNALTDGWRAPDQVANFSEQRVWQGFEQDDLDATIDLKTSKEIKTIKAGFLQHIAGWIFMPESVEYSFSNDGENFTKPFVVKNSISEKEPNATRHNFEWQGKKVSARYIRVFAKNRCVCPDWHQGAGGKAWIFSDEVEVH